MDVYSRKIVGWEIETSESATVASAVVEQAVLKEQCLNHPQVLHSDNGSPLKGATLQAKLQALNVTPSYSRPRVSNDNPFVESLFGTCKALPDFPSKGFQSLEQARKWVLRFVDGYNHHHRHSALQYVTPAQRHNREDASILAKRQATYAAAKARHPQRWGSRPTRDWTPVGAVFLNPEDPALYVGNKTAA